MKQGLDIRIRQVENGYVIYGAESGERFAPIRFVAATTEALRDLVKNLADEALPVRSGPDTKESLLRESIKVMANGDAVEERSLVNRIEKLLGDK